MSNLTVKFKLSVTAIAAAVFMLPASAQSGFMVQGTVTDQQGEPIIGATVMEGDGTATGGGDDYRSGRKISGLGKRL